MPKTIFLCLILIGSQTTAQLFKKEINRFNEEGLRTGLWKTFWDDEEKIPMSIANFENGKETGICKEFHNNGELRLKSRYYKNRIRMKYYSKNRKLQYKGWAIIDYSSNDIHFYWHGKWKYYNEKHRLIKFSLYENGNESLSVVK